jgi:hypothetical protein
MLKTIVRENNPSPSPPTAANLVIFTGSVTEPVTRNTVVNVAPTKINSEAVFSAALLNMG